MRRGMRWAAAVGAVLGLVSATAAAQGQEKGGAGMDLVELTNGTVVVGVLPPLGGRVVLLKTAGGENLLDSDPRLWKPPFPPPAIDTPFKPWNGRIVWVGPQTGFWSQQDLKPEHRTLLDDFFLHRLSYEEIARKHGLAMGSVGVYLKRGLEGMRNAATRHPVILTELEAFLR